MICYRCKKIGECNLFQTLYSTSDDFHIATCKNYDEASQYTYKKIADHDDLMHLIYDYFTNQLDGVTEEKAKKAITNALYNLNCEFKG